MHGHIAPRFLEGLTRGDDYQGSSKGSDPFYKLALLEMRQYVGAWLLSRSKYGIDVRHGGAERRYYCRARMTDDDDDMAVFCMRR